MDLKKDLKNAIDTVKALSKESPEVIVRYRRLLLELHHAIAELGLCSHPASSTGASGQKRKRDIDDQIPGSKRRRRGDQKTCPDGLNISTGDPVVNQSGTLCRLPVRRPLGSVNPLCSTMLG